MKSFEYIVGRIRNGDTNLPKDIHCTFFSYNFDEVFNKMSDNKFPESNNFNIQTEDGNVLAEVIYDPDADFNYFATERMVHDGTLLFIGETAQKVVEKVLKCNTYNKNIIDESQLDDDFFNTHHFKYRVGDVIMAEEHNGDFVPTGKPWMKDRTTAMLPIKFEVVDNVVDN